MSSPASIAKHPIHPMLVVFPIGLWIFSFVCDLIYLFVTRNPVWSEVAFYCIGGGIVGALLAAIPGFIDYLSLRDPQTKRIGTYHLILNLLAVVLFVVNFALRWNGAPGAIVPVVLSLITIAGLGVSGWLGGEMVYVHGVGVEPPTTQNAPQSKRRAS
jgi:uncharacterized membrane protein